MCALCEWCVVLRTSLQLTGHNAGPPTWDITFETVEAARQFVSLVRQQWRDAFHVDLQMNSSDIP